MEISPPETWSLGSLVPADPEGPLLPPLPLGSYRVRALRLRRPLGLPASRGVGGGGKPRSTGFRVRSPTVLPTGVVRPLPPPVTDRLSGGRTTDTCVRGGGLGDGPIRSTLGRACSSDVPVPRWTRSRKRSGSWGRFGRSLSVPELG